MTVATHSWLNAVSGDWSTAADWSEGLPDSRLATVVIAAVGDQYIVDINPSEHFTVGSVTLQAADATLEINGALTLAHTLTLSSGTLLLNGLITGGTLVANGGTFAMAGGTLSGSVYQGTLNGGGLTVKNGITVLGVGGSGPGTVVVYNASNSSGNFLTFSGSQTLDNATVDLAGFAGGGYNYFAGLTATGGTLTLGAHLTVTDTGLASSITGAFVNDGAINADYAGGVFSISGTHFTNNGVITVSNGDTLDLNGRYQGTGTITDAGGFVAGKLIGGTIVGPLFAGNAGEGRGLTIENGITVLGAGGGGPGMIVVDNTSNPYGNFLTFSGSQTLDNATVDLAGFAGAGYNYFAGLTATGGTLTLGAHLTITDTGLASSITGAFVNDGAINADYAGGHFYISATRFTNNGTITVSNGDTLDLTGSVSQALVDSIINSGGTLEVNGKVVPPPRQPVENCGTNLPPSHGASSWLAVPDLQHITVTNAAITAKTLTRLRTFVEAVACINSAQNGGIESGLNIDRTAGRATLITHLAPSH